MCKYGTTVPLGTKRHDAQQRDISEVPCMSCGQLYTPNGVKHTQWCV